WSALSFSPPTAFPCSPGATSPRSTALRRHPWPSSAAPWPGASAASPSAAAFSSAPSRGPWWASPATPCTTACAPITTRSCSCPWPNLWPAPACRTSPSSCAARFPRPPWPQYSATSCIPPMPPFPWGRSKPSSPPWKQPTPPSSSWPPSRRFSPGWPWRWLPSASTVLWPTRSPSAPAKSACAWRSVRAAPACSRSSCARPPFCSRWALRSGCLWPGSQPALSRVFCSASLPATRPRSPPLPGSCCWSRSLPPGSPPAAPAGWIRCPRSAAINPTILTLNHLAIMIFPCAPRSLRGRRPRQLFPECSNPRFPRSAQPISPARALAPLIPSGGVFVDVGANAGYFTALASRSVGPGGQVLAYEPSAQACDQLRAMVARNRMAQVEVIPVALTSRPGHVDLYVSSASGNHTPTLVPNAGGTATPVEARTLDTEFLRLGFSRIDVLKIDVEGYEGHVLAGASGLLAQGRIQYILCEFSPAWLAAAGTSCAELSERLESFGYERMRSTWLPSENPNRLYARSRALASSRACVHATASLPAPSSSF